jgi:hypothetical protein
MHHIVYNTPNIVCNKRNNQAALSPSLFGWLEWTLLHLDVSGARSAVIDWTTVYVNPVPIQEHQNVK